MHQTQFSEGKYFHVFNRGNNKENLFKEERNYEFFLQKMMQYLIPVCRIYSYCLMPNHFHLVLQIKEFDLLPPDYQTGKKKIHQPFSNLFNSYTKAINKSYNRTGSLFQEHPKRIEIKDENHLRDTIIYTHLNPVKHKFTDAIEDYPYSSYNRILDNSDSNLEAKKVLELFDEIDNYKYCHLQQILKNEEKIII